MPKPPKQEEDSSPVNYSYDYSATLRGKPFWFRASDGKYYELSGESAEHFLDLQKSGYPPDEAFRRAKQEILDKGGKFPQASATGGQMRKPGVGTIKYKASDGKVYEVDYDASGPKPSKAELEDYVKSRNSETPQQRLDRESEDLRQFYREHPYVKFDQPTETQDSVRSTYYHPTRSEIASARAEGLDVGKNGWIVIDYTGDEEPSLEEQRQYFNDQIKQARSARGVGTSKTYTQNQAAIARGVRFSYDNPDPAAQIRSVQAPAPVGNPFDSSITGAPIANLISNIPETVGGIGGAVGLPAMMAALSPEVTVPVAVMGLLSAFGGFAGSSLTGKAKESLLQRLAPAFYNQNERYLQNYAQRDPLGSMISAAAPNFLFGGPGTIATREGLIGHAIGGAIGAGIGLAGGETDPAKLSVQALLGALFSHETPFMRAVHGGVTATPGGDSYTPRGFSDYQNYAHWQALERTMGNARGEYNLLSNMGLPGLDRANVSNGETSRLFGGESSIYPRNTPEPTAGVSSGVRDLIGAWRDNRPFDLAASDPAGRFGPQLSREKIADAFGRYKEKQGQTPTPNLLDTIGPIGRFGNRPPAEEGLLAQAPAPGEPLPAVRPPASDPLLEPSMQAPALAHTETRQALATTQPGEQTNVPPSLVPPTVSPTGTQNTPVNRFTLPIEAKQSIVRGKRPSAVWGGFTASTCRHFTGAWDRIPGQTTSAGTCITASQRRERGPCGG
jgi:hypothetical protein